MTRQPRPSATQPLRAARSGRCAPRFWPTSVMAAVPNAAPDRKPSASQRMATPWALLATSPSRLTMLRNQNCPSATDMLSAAAGTLTRSSRYHRSQRGRNSRARSRSPARPCHRTTSTSRARRPRGEGALVAGSIAGSVTTWMPGSRAACTFPAIPTVSTARGSSALICARSKAVTAPAGPGERPVPAWAARTAFPVVPPASARPGHAEASSSGACARCADRAAASSADRPGPATTTTGADVNNLSAKLPATTLAAPASTDVADAGR